MYLLSATRLVKQRSWIRSQDSPVSQMRLNRGPVGLAPVVNTKSRYRPTVKKFIVQISYTGCVSTGANPQRKLRKQTI